MRSVKSDPASAATGSYSESNELYLKVGSIREVKIEADRLRYRTKVRRIGNRLSGGSAFTRGHIHQLLRNPIYVGELAHKGSIYDGQHEAIVDRETWDAVQVKLKEGAVFRHVSCNRTNTRMLRGLLYDETGARMMPTYASKNGRRYSYYVSDRFLQDPGDGTG